MGVAEQRGTRRRPAWPSRRQRLRSDSQSGPQSESPSRHRRTRSEWPSGLQSEWPSGLQSEWQAVNRGRRARILIDVPRHRLDVVALALVRVGAAEPADIYVVHRRVGRRVVRGTGDVDVDPIAVRRVVGLRDGRVLDQAVVLVLGQGPVAAPATSQPPFCPVGGRRARPKPAIARMATALRAKAAMGARPIL